MKAQRIGQSFSARSPLFVQLAKKDERDMQAFWSHDPTAEREMHAVCPMREPRADT